MTNEELTEYLYKSGRLPHWAYYQLNGKSTAENYRDQHLRLIEKEKADRELQEYKAQKKKEIDEELEAELEKELPKVLDEALDTLFQDWR